MHHRQNMSGYALQLTFKTSVLVLLSVKKWSEPKRDARVRPAISWNFGS